MGFNDIMIIEPASVSAVDRLDDVESGARERIAGRLQTRLRATVDPGVNLRSAVNAQAIRVASAGNEFVVDREDQANVLKSPADQKKEPAKDANEVTGVEELFELGSGVPSMANGKLVYRTISQEALFGEQRRAVHSQHVEQTVTSALRDEMLDAYQESFEEVQRRHPKI